MARYEMECVFSRERCRECALYRGRHYYLCYDRSYRGRISPPPPPADEHAAAPASPWHKEFFETPPEQGVGMEELRSMAAEIDLEFTSAELRARLADHPRCGPELAAAAHALLGACDERKFAPKVQLGTCPLVGQALNLVGRLETGPSEAPTDAPAVPAPARKLA